MPDKKTVDAYRSIRAPEELREKVLSSTKEENRPKNNIVVFRKISSVAAVLAAVVLASLVVVSPWNDVKVAGVNGKIGSSYTSVKDNENAAVFARYSDELTVPLTLDVSKDTEITVTDGNVTDEAGEMISAVGKGEKADIYWTIPAADEDVSYEMTLSNSKNTYLITLSFFTETDEWKICSVKQ